MASSKVTDCVYFDFAKAFDTVPHRRLLKRLGCYGIKGSVLNWITEFLNEITQIVNVNGTLSSKGKVISGVYQGSVLGPLLFVIYINDLPDRITSELLLFVDDTKLFKEVSNLEDSLMIQSDMYSMEEWSDT